MARSLVQQIINSKANAIINGNFDYWQRNTSFSSPISGAYTADRWRVDFDGTIGTYTVARQSFTLGQTDVPGEPLYFLRWNHTVAGSGSTSRTLSQRVESVKSFAGKSVTLSFYAKADTSRTLSMQLNQAFGTGGSPSATVVGNAQNFSVTTAWQKFTLTFSVASISGKTLGTAGNDFLNMVINLPLNAVFQLDIAQVMMNEGTASAPFKLSGDSLTGELIRCQRYFEKSYGVNIPPGTIVGEGCHTLVIQSGQAGEHSLSFKVTKRDIPGIRSYSTATGTIDTARDNGAGTDRTMTLLTAGMAAATVALAGTAPGTARYTYNWTADAEL